MSRPLTGVRVLEVAGYVFVSSAGAVLSDLGADVVKIEPRTGDPMRGMVNHLTKLMNTADAPSPFMEMSNRGKRSLALDIGQPRGREVLLRLVADADVFLTNALPSVRSKLKIDVDDIRAANPKIIYARGSGWGPHGPMRDKGAYDIIAGWAGSGIAHILTGADGEPPPMPLAIFDVQSGSALASAIGFALYRRAVSGEPSVVDVALLNTAMWAIQADIITAAVAAENKQMNRHEPTNPLSNWYPTSDGRWFYLSAMHGDRFWHQFCSALDRPDLENDPRFATHELRSANNVECAAVIESVFREQPVEHWTVAFADFDAPCGPLHTPRSVHQHPQVEPNGFINEHHSTSGAELRLVAPPMMFDESPNIPQGPAPEAGQHTEDVLLDAGFSWDEIGELHDAGLIGPA